MKGLNAIEWLVIAAIVLVASKFVIDYWSGVWEPTKEKAESVKGDFERSLGSLTSLPSLPQYPQGLPPAAPYGGAPEPQQSLL